MISSLGLECKQGESLSLCIFLFSNDQSLQEINKQNKQKQQKSNNQNKTKYKTKQKQHTYTHMHARTHACTHGKGNVMYRVESKMYMIYGKSCLLSYRHSGYLSTLSDVLYKLLFHLTKGCN